ncbi:MAG: 2-polyprenylphenol 6-hydroxylase [Pseudomonadota bacterium]|nr:2-polyprenylphenol 6-hydroxylase [Pseudomonadota bacterium]
MLALVRNLFRLFGIARTLAKYDALFPLESAGIAPGLVHGAKLLSRKEAKGRPGERLAAALKELGPSFIKLGQALSTRSDFLGEEVAADLSELQDNLPPFPGIEARTIITRELDAEMDSLFSSFEDSPVAAASIAQVHFAVTNDGGEVAVKVLRPGIEDAFGRDIELLRWLAGLVERTRPQLRRLKPLEIIRTFEETVRMEMDLRLEAAAAEELGENFVDDVSFCVPAVDWSRTARRVMTLERMGGIPIDERQALIDAGFSPEDILKTTAAAFFQQVFRDGYFHADQHPGNLFVGKGGEIQAVDFGIMGRLDKSTRRYLGEMLMSFLGRDYNRVAEIHFEAGYVPDSKSVESFAQACRSIAEPILDRPQNEISIARLLSQLFRVTESFEMETQPQLLLLQKTMLVAEGVGRKLYPEANMWFLAQPLIEDWVASNMGVEAQISQAVAEFADGLRRLPKVAADIEKSASVIAGSTLNVIPESVLGVMRAPKPRFQITWRMYLTVIAALILLLVLM